MGNFTIQLNSNKVKIGLLVLCDLSKEPACSAGTSPPSPPGKSCAGKQLQESWMAGRELQIGNKQINLLFSLLPASVAVYHGKARKKEKKKKNKKLLLNFLIVLASNSFYAEF